MPKIRLQNSNRRRALFGAEAGAILAAAGINAATQMVAAGINSSATKQAARDQANATIQSAQRQAQAVKDQTQRSKEYQKDAQEFVKEQNAENRELQKDIQMQLQMLTGAQNVNDRLEASKIKVKNGGSAKRRLVGRGMQQSLLRGGNMPFTVTDGGGVIPVGVTPEGFELYEIKGNDHEHYHKAQGGKAKTGVGIKFADGTNIEGEGNQNSNQGEYMLNTPDNAYFISKHTIGGVNPAQLINKGMHPLLAYGIQENIKAMNGITDDGKKKNNPPRRRLLGGNTLLYDMTNQSSPQIGVDTVGDTAVGVVAATKNKEDKESMKCGGRIRLRKVAGGPGNGGRTNYYGGNTSVGGYSTPQPPKPSFLSRAWTGVGNGLRSAGNWISGAGKSVLNWADKNADIVGAGITGLGNIGGALISAAGNRSASRTLSNAYTQAAGIMRDAYNSLQTIDMSSIKKEDYAAAHAMPALQAPVSFAGNKLALVDRNLQRRLSNVSKYSASGAAAQKRMNEAEVEAQDARNRVYSDDAREMQQIRQANAERVSQAAMFNAQQDNEANNRYAGAYLDLLKYNNEISNTKILGAAGAIAEGAVNGAGAIADAQTANAQAWSNVAVNTGKSFGDVLMSRYKTNRDYQNVIAGTDEGNKVSSVIARDDYSTASSLYNSYKAALNRTDLNDDEKKTYAGYIAQLESKFPRLKRSTRRLGGSLNNRISIRTLNY